MSRETLTLLLAALLAAGLTGLVHAQHQHDHGTAEPAPEAEDRDILYWYDPMHPEHRFDAPGPSPFMDMDLVPRYADEAPDVVSLAPGLAQRMNIRTVSIERQALPRIVSTVGAIDYDPTRWLRLHSRVAGWIESLSVHAVGDPVEAGQTLFTFYAPELVNAQEELLHAIDRGHEDTVVAAREKMRALGAQAEAIAEVEAAGRVQRALPWRAQQGGVIRDLAIREGQYVAAGGLLVEMADPASLWLTAEVFPSDVAKVMVGQQVEVRVPDRPGQTFEGRVDYLYPVLDPMTRTLRVRVPLINANGQLRSGTWAAVRLLADPADPVLAIPREALIRTGAEYRVVVREEDDRFRVHHVEPGMESNGLIEIRSGLEAGMEVVVSGQFLLDSEASFRAGFGRLEGPEPAAEEEAGTTVSATGDVRSIDAERRRIRLRHDPIPELGWPEMVMGFRVTGEWPAELGAGDEVHFEMRREPDEDGDYVIEVLHRMSSSGAHDHD